MVSLDVLYYALAVGFLVFVGFASYALYRLGKAFESLNLVIREVEDVARDIDMAKNLIKSGILSFILRLLGGSRRGGGQSERL